MTAWLRLPRGNSLVWTIVGVVFVVLVYVRTLNRELAI